jgi:hypothetical protein
MVIFTARPLYPEERGPGKHWIGGWVGPRTGLDDVEGRKPFPLPGLLWRLVRSQSLYRLRYPASFYEVYILPRGLRHEMSSPAQTLGSWVRIPLEALMSVRVSSVFVLSCVGSGFGTGLIIRPRSHTNCL